MASDTREPSSDVLLSKALTSVSSLVLLQLLSRLFTFVLNQALIRIVSPQVFGTAAIQFELLLSTILFLSREGVRNALLRASDKTQETKRAAVADRNLITNISVLPGLLGIPFAVSVALVYIYTTSTATRSQPHFGFSVTIYALAALFELLSEPAFIRAQNELRFDLRVRAEGIAVALKSVVTFMILWMGSVNWALPAFALGQAAYGVTLLATFMAAYRGNVTVWPKKVTTVVHGNVMSQYFEPELLQLSAVMTSQSLIKHFLTEGDKFMVSRFSPLADQGGYAIASNYGSLVARIVFQPIEETCRVFFARLLAPSSVTSDSLRTASHILLSILLLFIHLLLFLETFGPPYFAVAVTLVLPPRFLATSAPAILRVYIHYIPMMAFNGVLEAFFSSASSPVDLHAQSRWMVAFSVVFVFAAVGLARSVAMGDAGLIWANIINLACRAGYAALFAAQYFKSKAVEDFRWARIVPPKSVLGVFAISAAVTRWSEQRYQNNLSALGAQLGHVAVGGCCLMACLAACIVFERAALAQACSFVRRRPA
ncbi:Rft-1-domain-containing protein [Wolfiporia cocos MD-104 SS10]|uniref:Man(5)GlcNAc(2)-PP-dolichol translocation protein RFT1 n=1 Tax=Wolfiporia cocos (strain MD-104) TaxID=742152 RepID=A0A2H3JKB6_WOLCO|nr:Rft-1-domain-containing protein [Wolfiporia cocos MD-104 SS10]